MFRYCRLFRKIYLKFSFILVKISHGGKQWHLPMLVGGVKPPIVRPATHSAAISPRPAEKPVLGVKVFHPLHAWLCLLPGQLLHRSQQSFDQNHQ